MMRVIDGQAEMMMAMAIIMVIPMITMMVIVMDDLAEMMVAIIMVIPMITMMMMVMGDLAEQRGVSTSYIEWNAEKLT